jgi:hypothetical protein
VVTHESVRLTADPPQMGCCLAHTGFTPPCQQPPSPIHLGAAVAAVPTFVGYQGADRVTAFSGADKAMLLRLAKELSGHHTKAPGQ